MPPNDGSSATDAGLLATITYNSPFHEIGLTFEQFKEALDMRSGPHPSIHKIALQAGEGGIGIPSLRKAIQSELKLQKSVKGPYLVLYLRHFPSAYRLEGGELPRDMRVVGLQVEAAEEPSTEQADE